MSAAVLDVFLHGSLAGKLYREGEGMVFRYQPAYLSAAFSIPLSLSLPLRKEAFPPETSRTFFANLLPEGAVREFVARRHRVSAEDDFGLLEALGGDCAGAVILFPEGEAPPAGESRYRSLSEGDLEKLSEEPFVAAPSFLPKTVLRLSLAGAQDKLPVAVFDGRIHLPESGAPSTHILKPRHHRFRTLPENEAFCMRLAARAGLPVPEARLLQVADGFYLVERYDRRREGDTVLRIHQEDFCQALGIVYSRKYEAEGGPGFSRCAELLRRSREPIPARQNLIRWAVFNFLIGNADAHAKNLSLLFESPVPSLAPFYDLVCTAVYPISGDMAMAIGGVSDPRLLSPENWSAFAGEVGERRDVFVLRTLEEMSRALPEAADTVGSEMSREYGDSEVYGQILEVIRRRSDALLRWLAAEA